MQLFSERLYLYLALFIAYRTSCESRLVIDIDCHMSCHRTCILAPADVRCHCVRDLVDDVTVSVTSSMSLGQSKQPQRTALPIRLFANDVIIIGSVRADWLAPCNATIGNPRADKLGRNGFECIILRCSVDRDRCVLTTCMHSAIESYSMLHLQRWLACRGIKRSGTKSLFMIMSHNCQSCM